MTTEGRETMRSVYPATKFAPAEVVREDLGDGAFVLRSPQPFEIKVKNLSELLDRWAVEAPDRPYLMERGGGDTWQGVSYAEAHTQVQSLAAFLLAQGLGPDRPLLILSGNSVRHGVLMLAAMHVGIPVVPVSVPYSLHDKTLAKLRHIVSVTSPGMAYAADSQTFANAFDYLGGEGITLLSDDGTLTYDAALQTPISGDVVVEAAKVDHKTVAKILFTSGSTGMPKGVIVNQEMMLASQQALVQIWPFLGDEPPVIVDWLPWNHTFGGNFNFNQILWNGGTFYIDDGKPVPGEIEKTMRNIRDVSPTLYFNVPKGFDMMLPVMREDAALRKAFFERLQLIFFSGAGLPDHLWEGLEELGVAERGETVPFVSAWGATEAMLITCVHFQVPSADVIGLPTPGYELKFLPNGGKLEMRVRGPHVTPGYLNNAKKTVEAFDEYGFYLTGDAGRLVDQDDLSKGIYFDGRTSENFKLMTGTWVAVGNLRIALLDALKPIVSDAVITGHNRNDIGALLFLNADECKTLAGRVDDLAGYASDPAVRAFIEERLSAYNAGQTGSATRVKRVLVQTDAPSVERNEITDKGYINQRLALELRDAAVSELYEGSERVIASVKVHA
ncbi:feruloyl-CoA synthase [Tropicibacter sp. R16_0]|uniref:feruloyl-CoA synthase n=1 Tax=Tropicibacter sp. R16_0 TaxID=2821102 RepID=UPI001ADC6609|nr:feruloyl-CoA synthase [Tropicibacter sp. R16_0]MBO9448832.1 feruloyl-CoA synthase [Tropicibacter sp. R16_0]